MIEKLYGKKLNYWEINIDLIFFWMNLLTLAQ